MYEYLEGQVADCSPGRLVLDVGGVGYELWVPLSSRFAPKGQQKLWIHFVAREDAHRLYAFAERATRDWFRLLLEVSGVGPKIALGLVSGMTRGEFLRAVAAGDAAALTRVKGVGKRTADQVLLDLREKVALIARAEAQAAPQGRGELVLVPAQREAAIAALNGIGYSDKEARKAVEKAVQDVGEEDLERLVRAALSR